MARQNHLERHPGLSWCHQGWGCCSSPFLQLQKETQAEKKKEKSASMYCIVKKAMLHETMQLTSARSWREGIDQEFINYELVSRGERTSNTWCVCVCDSFKPHSSGILISNGHPEIGFASLESGFSPNQQLRNNLREFLRQMIIYTQVTVRFLAVFSASFFCFTDCPSPAHSYKLLIVFFPTPSSMGNVQVHSESTDCIFFFQLASRFIDLDQVEVSWAKMSFSSADWNTVRLLTFLNDVWYSEICSTNVKV